MNKRALTYLGAASLTLAVAFLYVTFKADGTTQGEVVETNQGAQEALVVNVARGELQSPPVRLKTTPGVPVLLTVNSDVADEAHLHGVDMVYTIPAGKPTTLRLATTMTGAFELELHTTPVTIGVLEVYPQ